jgi:hypothetical protein
MPMRGSWKPIVASEGGRCRTHTARQTDSHRHCTAWWPRQPAARPQPQPTSRLHTDTRPLAYLLGAARTLPSAARTLLRVLHVTHCLMRQRAAPLREPLLGGRHGRCTAPGGTTALRVHRTRGAVEERRACPRSTLIRVASSFVLLFLSRLCIIFVR